MRKYTGIGIVEVQVFHEKEVVHHQIKYILDTVMGQDLQLPLRYHIMGFEGSHQINICTPRSRIGASVDITRWVSS